jgi:hypothetical protein
VLAFDRVYEISQVQILSHQAKIATKIEIFPGVALHGGVVADYRDAEFKRLGYSNTDLYVSFCVLSHLSLVLWLATVLQLPVVGPQ